MTAPARTRAAPPAIDVIVESPLWANEPAAAAVVRKAIGAAAHERVAGDHAVAVVLTDDATIRALNRRWRGIDKPTNVLSFPADAFAGGSGMLGDIAIAYETAAREAQAERKTLTDHVSHLAVHGFLHLLGYDHQSDESADAMEGLERSILARLGMPDPYAIRDTG